MVITGASKATRDTTDKAYRSFVNRVNTLIEVNGDTDYLDLVNKMNKLIEYQPSVLAARDTKNTNKKKKEDDRPVID